ncbi:hypothetical protein Csa_010734, partial [Cucumis sativus]
YERQPGSSGQTASVAISQTPRNASSASPPPSTSLIFPSPAPPAETTGFPPTSPSLASEEMWAHIWPLTCVSSLSLED